MGAPAPSRALGGSRRPALRIPQGSGEPCSAAGRTGLPPFGGLARRSALARHPGSRASASPINEACRAEPPRPPPASAAPPHRRLTRATRLPPHGAAGAPAPATPGCVQPVPCSRAPHSGANLRRPSAGGSGGRRFRLGPPLAARLGAPCGRLPRPSSVCGALRGALVPRLPPLLAAASPPPFAHSFARRCPLRRGSAAPRGTPADPRPLMGAGWGRALVRSVRPPLRFGCPPLPAGVPPCVYPPAGAPSGGRGAPQPRLFPPPPPLRGVSPLRRRVWSGALCALCCRCLCVRLSPLHPPRPFAPAGG